MRTAALLSLAIVITGVALIAFRVLDDKFFVSVPRHGGSISEGIVGRPHLINPISARSDADKDLVALIYSGLMRPSITGNNIEPDLASSIAMSPDGKTYTVTLRDGLVFHDGKSLTTDDVAFTIARIQEKSYHSVLAPAFFGVKTTIQDSHTIIFELTSAHATFPSMLTFGVLPKHLWREIGPSDDDTQYNIRPIGSGPYKLKSIERNKSTELISAYNLESFDKYAHGEPHIESLRLEFFGNEEDMISALREKRIDSIASVSVRNAKMLAKEEFDLKTSRMPRILGIYFNQQKSSVLADPVVREALALSLARNRIASEAFAGYATPEAYAFPGITEHKTIADDMGSLEASSLLEKNGWTRSNGGVWTKTEKGKQPIQLSFTLTVPKIEDINAAADIAVASWRALGIQVTTSLVDYDAIGDKVIAPRAFEALFFGEVTGRDIDPRPFWYSKEKTGANLAQYSSKTADTLIEDLAKITSETERLHALESLADVIRADNPAIFAFSPQFIYPGVARIKRTVPKAITTPAERFAGIETWHVDTQRVWAFLKK